ncbi:hypothetical protein Tco_0197427, partial [Tanacetum coccineum]
ANNDTSDKEIHESSSKSDSERTESETETAAPKDDKDQGEVDSSTVSSGVSIPISDPVKAHEALAGPDPEPMKEDQTGSDSAVHHTGDDYVLGNLKFVPKGESVEVFGMAIPDPLITEAIQQSSYYPKYLKMVAENTKKTPQESASVQPATKHAPPKKTTTTTPVKQSKPAPASTKKPSKHKLPQKIRKGKPTF